MVVAWLVEMRSSLSPITNSRYEPVNDSIKFQFVENTWLETERLLLRRCSGIKLTYSLIGEEGTRKKYNPYRTIVWRDGARAGSYTGSPTLTHQSMGRAREKNAVHIEQSSGRTGFERKATPAFSFYQYIYIYNNKKDLNLLLKPRPSPLDTKLPSPWAWSPHAQWTERGFRGFVRRS